MADNVAITAGSGTTIAADDIGGVLTQRVKVQWGPDGTVNDADTASGKPLPVQLRSSTGTAGVIDAHGSVQSTMVDSSGNAITFNANGQATMANSAPTVLASDMPALKGYYVTTAVSTTGILQSSAGASGDFLDFITVFPGTSTCGGITVSDSTTGVITYTGGSSISLSTLTPFTINIGAFSRVGPWKVSTGGNITCVSVGKFS